MNFDKENLLYTHKQVCPLIILQLLASSSPTYFILGNVHLNHNELRGDRKLSQSHLITSGMLQLKEYIATKGNKVVCILGGDFNSTPSSGIFEYFTKESYNCKSLPLRKISGQREVGIPKEGVTEEWYKKTVCNTLYYHSEKKENEEGVERLLLWYMTIHNLYVEYDIFKRTLIARYKMDLPLLYSLNERRNVLSALEKRKLRELFSNSLEEVASLEDSKSNPSNDLITYVMKSPIVFKNAYSEVLKQLCQYIKGYSTSELEAKTYKLLPSIKEVKERVGTRFNDIELNYDRWEETEKQLEGHTYESGYSHWVDKLLKCDYIFYSGEGLVPVNAYAIPPFEEIMELGGICPNEVIPSDHLPIACTFYYLP